VPLFPACNIEHKFTTQAVMSESQTTDSCERKLFKDILMQQSH